MLIWKVGRRYWQHFRISAYTRDTKAPFHLKFLLMIEKLRVSFQRTNKAPLTGRFQYAAALPSDILANGTENRAQGKTPSAQSRFSSPYVNGPKILRAINVRDGTESRNVINARPFVHRYVHSREATYLEMDGYRC